ncbi:polysaccharide deacetylase family protein [Paenibacillus tarimensis]
MGDQIVKEQEMLLVNNNYYLPAGFFENIGLKSSYDKKKKTLLFTKSQGSSVNYSPVYYKDQVIVLMYHNITKRQGEKNELHVDSFRKQMEGLKNEGFNVISMDQYAEFMLKKKSIPANAVLITFDDGYQSFYELAYPILREFNYPATNFVIVKWIDQPYGIPKVTWDQMREMKKNGMSFYNHTYDSHYYGTLDAGQDKKKPALSNRLYLKEKKRKETLQEYRSRVKKDLERAEKRLQEELGNKYSMIAFPYGAFNQDVLDIAEKIGIKLTFTVKPGVVTRGVLNGNRINAGNRDNNGVEMLKDMQTGLKKKTVLPIKVFYEKKEILFNEIKPITIGSTLWLPVRQFSEMFGYNPRLDKNRNSIRL